MTPQYREIIHLNRELGEATGIIEVLAVEYKKQFSESTLSMVKEFLIKVENRKSFLADE